MVKRDIEIKTKSHVPLAIQHRSITSSKHQSYFSKEIIFYRSFKPVKKVHQKNQKLNINTITVEPDNLRLSTLQEFPKFFHCHKTDTKSLDYIP